MFYFDKEYMKLSQNADCSVIALALSKREGRVYKTRPAQVYAFTSL
jgi:hypothetical protein